jgi:hypothetical protein
MILANHARTVNAKKALAIGADGAWFSLYYQRASVIMERCSRRRKADAVRRYQFLLASSPQHLFEKHIK